MSVEEPPQRSDGEAVTTRGELCLQFNESCVSRLLNDLKGEVSLGLDALRAPVASLRGRLRRTTLTRTLRRRRIGRHRSPDWQQSAAAGQHVNLIRGMERRSSGQWVAPDQGSERLILLPCAGTPRENPAQGAILENIS